MKTIALTLYAEDGFGITAIFVAIALAAMVAMAMAWGSRSVSSSTYTNSCVTQIVAQAQLIRQKISRCAIEYPSGNNGGSFHLQYPAGTAVNVSTLICPGNNNANLWNGADGMFLPNAPNGFNAWTYTNDGTSVRISIAPSTATTFCANCLNQTAAKFSAAEASVASNILTVLVTN